ncbi:hypothetical protein IWW34DRAFT_756697 [Fusarium oxysporum f. sp. albedinis]|nr:hypothetical protein IWW34DRAFT_756697 [Fusarium oxysporum f. sp. albedinis]
MPSWGYSLLGTDTLHSRHRIHRPSLAYRCAYNSTPGFAALMRIGRLFLLEYSRTLYSYTTLVLV